jgi:hypothetical protein
MLVFPTNFLDDVLLQFTDPGTLGLILLAAAIPVFFYILHRLVVLLPKR